MITYTQHTVAFPALGLSESWYSDELSVTDESKTGELILTFMDFTSRDKGVRLNLFGDSLHLLSDYRIQYVLAMWGTLDDPDDATPGHFIAWLGQMGIGPSEYQLRNSNAR